VSASHICFTTKLCKSGMIWQHTCRSSRSTMHCSVHARSIVITVSHHRTRMDLMKWRL